MTGPRPASMRPADKVRARDVDAHLHDAAAWLDGAVGADPPNARFGVLYGIGYALIALVEAVRENTAAITRFGHAPPPSPHGWTAHGPADDGTADDPAPTPRKADDL